MKKALKMIFRSILPVRVRQVRRLGLRDIAKKYGRGNIYIKQGRIMTASEYAARKSAVLAYDF